MSKGGDQPSEKPRIELFLGEPTRNLSHWEWLWTEDVDFPVRSHRSGFFGELIAKLKRLARPLVKVPLNDLWDRQRAYNLILLEKLEEQRHEFQAALAIKSEQIERLEAQMTTGLHEVMGHNDALFARVDQKLDRYRREAKDLWSGLGAFIAAMDASGDSSSLAEIQREQEYVDLELRHRGSEAEIAERIAAYLPYFSEGSKVLDLGCGRGEALDVLHSENISVHGIDSSGEMVARCLEKGLSAERADLFDYLEGVDEGSLGGVVSFHVIEHLPPESLAKLVRLAWRALHAGGVLILETPNPLSLVMSARNFWVDPTHVRPVHPAGLENTFRAAGFEPVHRIDLHPFPETDRLPEIDLASIPEDQRQLADRVNRLRDLLDELLFGCRDYGMVGVKS